MGFTQILLVCLTVASAFCLTISHKPDSDKVLIDFYIESKCRDCRNALLGPIKDLINTKDIFQILEINLYPYGNSNRHKNGTEWVFQCQHGPQQCVGNRIQTCSLKLYDKYTQAIPYVLCLEREGKDSVFAEAGPKCAEEVGLDWQRINQCASSSQGVKYEIEMGLETEKAAKLTPQVPFVPMLVVNKQYKNYREEMVFFDHPVKYICNHYNGSVQIQACRPQKA